jgi:two-component system response regulator
VLAAVKGDDQLKTIPIIVLTCSPADVDLLRAYNLHANCYIAKPVEFDEFVKVVQRIEAFWFSVVKLPVNRPFPS